MNTVAKPKQELAPLAPATNALTPMEMLDRAVQAGATVETLDKIMAMQERWEANQARKAFNTAIAATKAEIKPVIKNRQGHNSKKYADFAAIAASVDPILAKHNLGYRFRSQAGDRITVTCILFHSDGHAEETTLSGPPDKTGSKNDIQAIGSTLTYLQRYSLVQMLGIAAADDDDGAKASIGGEKITEKQASNIIDLLASKNMTHEKFLKWVRNTAPHVERIEDIPLELYDACIDGIKAVKS